MPVKISSELNSTDPRAITLTEYNEGKANFEMHYFHSAEALPFGGKDFSFLWSDLENNVKNFIAQTGIPSNEVCLRFVHCFDSATESLYLRLQICKMVETPIIDYGKQLYMLDDSACVWLSLKQDECVATPEHTLEDVNYLSNFYYTPVEGAQAMECLIEGGPNKFVRNLVFPWEEEIQQMYIDNNSPSGASVNFASCSYTHHNEGDESVAWPHGLVIYLSDASGAKMLNDDEYISIFRNRGADVSTLCPPLCNAYLKPNTI